MGETIGAQIVQVPMSEPVRLAEVAFGKLLLVFVGLFVFTLAALNLLFYGVVVRPIRRLAVMADRVSRGDVDVEDVRVSGRDEVATLAGSFGRMRISLAKAMSMLEEG
jgi:protein-histidine pros-kinase